MGIFVDTFVWVKAATRDALEDSGPFPITKVSTRNNGTNYDIFWNTSSLAMVMSTMPIVPTVPSAVT